MRKNIKIATLVLPLFNDLEVGTLIIISDENTNPHSFALAIVCDKKDWFGGGVTDAIVINPHGNTYPSGEPWKAGEKFSSLAQNVVVIPVTQTVFGQLYDGQPFMQYGNLWKRVSLNEGINAECRTERFQSMENVYAVGAEYVVTPKRFTIKPRTMEELKLIGKGTKVIVRDENGNYALCTFERSVAADTGEVSVKRSITNSVKIDPVKPYDTPWRKRDVLFYSDEDALDKVIPVAEDFFGTVHLKQVFMHGGELWKKMEYGLAISESGEEKAFKERTTVFDIDREYTYENT